MTLAPMIRREFLTCDGVGIADISACSESEPDT